MCLGSEYGLMTVLGLHTCSQDAPDCEQLLHYCRCCITTKALILIAHPGNNECQQSFDWWSWECAGDMWHVCLEGLKEVSSLCYGWRAEADVAWEGRTRFHPGQPSPLMLHHVAHCLSNDSF